MSTDVRPFEAEETMDQDTMMLIDADKCPLVDSLDRVMPPVDKFKRASIDRVVDWVRRHIRMYPLTVNHAIRRLLASNLSDAQRRDVDALASLKIQEESVRYTTAWRLRAFRAFGGKHDESDNDDLQDPFETEDSVEAEREAAMQERAAQELGKLLTTIKQDDNTHVLYQSMVMFIDGLGEEITYSQHLWIAQNVQRIGEEIRRGPAVQSNGDSQYSSLATEMANTLVDEAVKCDDDDEREHIDLHPLAAIAIVRTLHARKLVSDAVLRRSEAALMGGGLMLNERARKSRNTKGSKWTYTPRVVKTHRE